MRHRLRSLAPAALFLSLVVFAEAALAHPGHDGASGFWRGLLHPLTGADHLLAMLAVGLWSALRGASASPAIRLRLPLCFVLAAGAGTALGAAGVFDVRIEIAIAASLLALGLALLSKLGREHAAALCLVAICGLLHGGAHGNELAGAAGMAPLAGFLAGTLLLHVTGALLVLALPRSRRGLVRTASGTGLAAAGLWLLAA